MGDSPENHLLHRTAAARVLAYPHLTAGGLAAVVLIAAAVAFAAQGQRSAQAAIHRLAPLLLKQKDRGIVLQRAAYREENLLPFYGSSELDRPVRFRASDFFRAYPTGFAIVPVGEPGYASLLELQELAAQGDELRGKKLVITLSPITFHQNQRGYAADFSPLHATATLFSMDLSFALRRKIARRMLTQPKSLEHQPLLDFAAWRLRRNKATEDLLYCILIPLGKLQYAILALQDHWATREVLRENQSPAQTPSPQVPDWPALVAEATEECILLAGDRPFGLQREAALFPHLRSNDEYRRTLHKSTEWKDLELLTELLKELGACPLFLSYPLNGPYLDSLGIPRSSRQLYYDRLQKALHPFQFALRDFQDHDNDPYFTNDSQDHPSAKGWIHFDQAIDAFYHAN